MFDAKHKGKNRYGKKKNRYIKKDNKKEKKEKKQDVYGLADVRGNINRSIKRMRLDGMHETMS